MEQNTIAKAHRLTVDNRKRTCLTGIKDVVAFDVNQVLLESSMGMVLLKGSDLKVTRLSLEKGEVDVDGHIDGITYSEVTAYGEKGKSIIKRMFR
jgi:sporulation protein YabP